MSEEGYKEGNDEPIKEDNFAKCGDDGSPDTDGVFVEEGIPVEERIPIGDEIHVEKGMPVEERMPIEDEKYKDEIFILKEKMSKILKDLSIAINPTLYTQNKYLNSLYSLMEDSKKEIDIITLINDFDSGSISDFESQIIIGILCLVFLAKDGIDYDIANGIQSMVDKGIYLNDALYTKMLFLFTETTHYQFEREFIDHILSNELTMNAKVNMADLIINCITNDANIMEEYANDECIQDFLLSMFEREEAQMLILFLLPHDKTNFGKKFNDLFDELKKIV